MTPTEVRDRPTRGRSRPGRLRLLDAALVVELAAWWREAPPDAEVVDLGVGAYPWTVAELAGSVRAVAPQRPVSGLEIHPRFARRGDEVLRGHGIPVRQGGFDGAGPPAAMVRLMNVLRDYRAEEVGPALDRVAGWVVDGGWIVEGGCSLDGDVVVTRWWQVVGGRRALRGWGFGTTFDHGFAPAMMRPRLAPDARQDWRDPRTSAGALAQAWTDAFAQAGASRSARVRWRGTAAALGAAGWSAWMSEMPSGAWLAVDPSPPVAGRAPGVRWGYGDRAL